MSPVKSASLRRGRHAAVTWLLLIAWACSESFDPGVSLEVGQGCTEVGTATGSAGTWHVTAYITQRTPRTVTGKNGVQITQVLLTCLTRTCNYTNTTLTKNQAIDRCYNG